MIIYSHEVTLNFKLLNIEFEPTVFVKYVILI
jgi:hypothetical protein